MLTLDHLVVTAPDLAAATAELETRLGVPFAPGGKHQAMGTHNRLLSLGPDEYLEIIAIDPEAPGPDQPRWYALDEASGPPALTHWAARTDAIDAMLNRSPRGAGIPWDLARGDLRWRMAVPETGQTPFSGGFPALLEWQTPHPAPRLPDRGIRLNGLTITSPQAAELRAALTPLIDDARVRIETGPSPRLAAKLSTPTGPVTL